MMPGITYLPVASDPRAIADALGSCDSSDLAVAESRVFGSCRRAGEHGGYESPSPFVCLYRNYTDRMRKREAH